MVYGVGLESTSSFDSIRSDNLVSGISPIFVLEVMKVMVEVGRILPGGG